MPKFNRNYPLEPESLEFLALCLMQDTWRHYIRNDISRAVTVKLAPATEVSDQCTLSEVENSVSHSGCSQTHYFTYKTGQKDSF